MIQRSLLVLTFALLASSAMAQAPVSPATQPSQQQTRGIPNSEQQLLDRQRERADEYYRRLREYVASVAKMA